MPLSVDDVISVDLGLGLELSHKLIRVVVTSLEVFDFSDNVGVKQFVFVVMSVVLAVSVMSAVCGVFITTSDT